MPETTPEIPAEIWGLWRDEDEDHRPGWVPALDNPRGAENYLMCFSEADATAACEHQRETYEVKCRPVRIK